LVAFAAKNGERYDDAIAALERVIVLSAFHDFAHEFVTHDVAVFHARHESVE